MGYWNDIDPKETKQIIQQDCYRTRAQSALDDESGGRFSRVNPSKVTGAEPISYPALPENSPWASDPVPPGDAIDKLGFDISAVEPVIEDLSLAAAASSGFSSAGDSGAGQGRSANRPIDNAAPSHNQRSATPYSSPETARQGREVHSPWPPSQPPRFRRRF